MTTQAVPSWALGFEDREKLRGELHDLLERLAVRHGKSVLVSGIVSDFYVDCRVVTMLPDAMWAIGRLFLDTVSDIPNIKAVGGLTLGADPISAAVAMASGLTTSPIPMFIVRKTPKGHGTRQLIEGPFPSESDAAVMIVDDVITKGGSVSICHQGRYYGNTGTRCLCCVDSRPTRRRCRHAQRSRLHSSFFVHQSRLPE